MDRAEATGFGVAVVGHVALFAALSLGLAQIARAPSLTAPMEVSFVEDVGLVASAPEPTPEPQAQGSAPEVGPVEDAAPAAAPQPAPAPPVPRESIQPVPRQPAPKAATRQTRQGTTGTGERTRRAGLGDLDPRSFGRDPASRSNRPAAAMNAQAAADIGSAITRQVQPCADRQVDPGPGANRIVTTLNLRLNRDGSLAARPRVVRQSGLNDDNRRYADRVADLAVASFVGCSPLRGLPAELYDVPRGWSNFTMNYRLPG